MTQPIRSHLIGYYIIFFLFLPELQLLFSVYDRYKTKQNDIETK